MKTWRLVALLLMMLAAGLPASRALADAPQPIAPTTRPAGTISESPVPDPDGSVPTSTAALAVDTPGAPTISGPTVSIDPVAVKPGERVVVAITGFLDTVSTIAVCGNNALRGSQDCDMTGSYSLRVGASYVQGLSMLIAAPPTTCPCIIRITSNATEEIAATPITIIGHAVGPLVGPATFGELVDVTISAVEAPRSFWGSFRPELGGATPFEVTVTIHNMSTATLHNIEISAAVGHKDTDYLADITFGRPDALGSGQTWKQTVRAVVKPPSYGRLRWRVSVSGAGPTVSASETMERKPVLLMIACLIVVGAVFMLIIRLLVRRHIRREERNEAKSLVEPPAGSSEPIDTTAIELDDQEPALAR